MACPWEEQIAYEEHVVIDTLRANDHQLHESAWLGYLQERQEVHAFIICFFEKGLDPIVISRTL